MVFLLLATTNLKAQESPVVAGGEATGESLTISYSVGQLVYTTNTGNNGSVAQGIQQAYQISTVVGINKTNLRLEVYPNPTTNLLQLVIEDNKLENLEYQLYDLKGKLIKNKKVNTGITNIEMSMLPTSTYLLNINNNKQTIKSFKIIKK